MGQGYGRIGTRRKSGGAWQWMLIGFFPGILCGGAVIFGLSIIGLLDGFGAGATPTPQVVTTIISQNIVVTATADPAQPTATPLIITATPDANAAAANPDVVVVDSTQENTDIVLAPTATATGGAIIALPGRETATLDSAIPTQDVAAQGVTGSSPGVEAVSSIVPVTPPTVAPAAAEPAGSVIPDMLAGEVSTLVTIPGTTFRMGTNVDEILIAVNECQTRDNANCEISYGEDSTPSFEVQLDTYQMEVTEVTFGQYAAFLNYLRSQGRNHLDGCEGGLCIQTQNENSVDGVITFDGANYTVPPLLVDVPVYAVTWEGASTYCQAIGRRLPTEAEWELAARGTDGRIYPWGNDWDGTRARTNRSEGAAESPGPITVGTLLNNSPYQIQDMAGNVAEWVDDWYSATYYQQMSNQAQPVFNPTGAAFTGEKVLRGGSWNTVPFFTRTVHRQSYVPRPDSNTERFPRWIGFRCAADAGTDTAAQTGTGVVNASDLGTGLAQTGTDDNAAPVLDAPDSETTANEQP